MITISNAIPDAWAASLTGGVVGLGYDIATTTKAKSNPSALTVTEHVGNLYIERLVVRWKTHDDAVAMAVLEAVVGHIRAREIRPRRLCVDASNEAYFASAVARNFAGRLPVEAVRGGENVDWKGGVYQSKVLLGNLYVTAYEDNHVACPPAEWLFDDRRLVVRERGSFVANIGDDGGHADTFDSGKLALWAIEHGGGIIEAGAARVGAFDQPAASGEWDDMPHREQWRRPGDAGCTTLYT